MHRGSSQFTRSFFCFILVFIYASAYGQKAPEQLVVSGTVLLKDKAAPDNKALLASLKTTWKLKADSINFGEKTLVFNTIAGATVMVAYLEYPIAPDELGAAARLSWLWKTAAEETSKHQAQVVISVIGSANHSLDLHKIFTQTAAAVLEVTRSPGIYMDGQYLLLSAGYYAAAARNMVQNQSIPLYCWVYFGRPGSGNGFTYGLTEFGLPEMEIVNAAHAEAEVHAVLYDASMAVVKYGTLLKDGQTLSTEEGGKFVVHLTQGTYLEDKKVLKLDY
ncbi:MAG: DUF4261 domain-containing protein [Phycisphaerae bacterium]|nr:DUF4261 domain-containing protein [Saprospiraceae bacterium]